MAELAGQLQLIRDEIAARCYDPLEVDTRIRHAYEQGRRVHSLCHALLKIAALATA